MAVWISSAVSFGAVRCIDALTAYTFHCSRNIRQFSGQGRHYSRGEECYVDVRVYSAAMILCHKPSKAKADMNNARCHSMMRITHHGRANNKENTVTHSAPYLSAKNPVSGEANENIFVRYTVYYCPYRDRLRRTKQSGHNSSNEDNAYSR